MRQKSERPARVQGQSQIQDKGNKSSSLRQVRMLFRNGGAYTAKEINRLVGTNDARKLISMLRAEGVLIKDVYLESGCKRYWLETDEFDKP